jgi:C1A family cysteine protease
VIGAKAKVDSMKQSAAQQELSQNLEAILGELAGQSDVSKVLQDIGLGDSSLVQLDDSNSAPGTKTLEQRGTVFHNQSHTVLIVGWGFDKDTQTKYWIIRNSYGPTWGDHGDFKMQRGNDDFGIEANLVSYDPVLCSESSSETCIPI